MKRLDNIQTKIKKELKNAMIELELPQIRVYFNHNNRLSFRHNKLNDYMAIHIDSLELMSLCTKEYRNLITYKRFKLNGIQKRFYFIIYHELGHYIQKYKHEAWFFKYRQLKIQAFQNNKCNTNREYRDLRLEHNADKIATILLYKLKGFKKA